MIGRIVHEEVLTGTSWYTAATVAGLEGEHHHRIRQAQRLAKQHAKFYGHEWPIEGADSHDGREAFSAMLQDKPWDAIAQDFHYRNPMAAERHAIEYSVTNGLSFARLYAGKTAYRMRGKGKTWKEIAAVVELPQKEIMAATGEYARQVGFPWPPRAWSYRPEIGELAYKMRVSSRALEWADIADELDTTVSTALFRAKQYAKINQKGWPPLRHVPTIGELAYKIKVERYPTWDEVGEELGRAAAWCQDAARRYAQEHHLTWPIPIPIRVGLRMNRCKTGPRAYELRIKGGTWEAIAEEIGVGHRYALRSAREYAKEHDLPWPILLEEPDDPGQEIYQKRLEGFAWEDVAEAVGTPLPTVLKQCKRYARKHHLIWPPQLPPQRQQSERAAKAYNLGVKNKMPWVKVAERLGYASDQSALNSAKTYAERAGLPYQRQRRRFCKRDPDRPRRAYELRAATGRSWREVGEEVGYVYHRGAHTAAKLWAEQNGLPWPPPTPSGEDDE